LVAGAVHRADDAASELAAQVVHLGVDGSRRIDAVEYRVKQLTAGEDDSWDWSSPDSRWVVYHSGKQGRRTLWRIPVEGGKPAKERSGHL